LFKADAAIYESSIQQINGSETLASSMLVFNDLKVKFNWQEDDEVVERFLKIVKNKYA
jgi:hypothetical protein